MVKSTFRLLAGAALLACTSALPVDRFELTKPLTVEIDTPCEHTAIPIPSMQVPSLPAYTPEPSIEATEEPEFTPEPSMGPEETPQITYPVEPSMSPSTSAHPSASVSPIYPSRTPSTSSAPVYPSSSPVQPTASPSVSSSTSYHPSATASASPTTSYHPPATPSSSASPHPEDETPTKCHIRNFDFKTQTAEQCCEKRFKCGSVECHGSKACENPDMCYCRKPLCRKVYIHYSYHKELSGDCAHQLIHL